MDRQTRFTRALREILWYRHGGRCRYCGQITALPRTGNQPNYPDLATVDHIYPSWDLRSRLPEGMHRVVLSCYQCNQARAARDFPSWKKYCDEHPIFDIRELLTP